MVYRGRAYKAKKKNPFSFKARKRYIRRRRIPRPLSRPRIIGFKRSRTEIITLNNTSAPSGWSLVDNGLAIPLVFSLSQIPDSTDFINLFNSYKLVGIRMQGWYSNTVAADSNQQSIMYYCGNSMGNVLGSELSEQYFLDRPSHRKRVLVNSTGKPSVDLYMRLSQLAMVYQSITNTDYGLIKPRFISTGETQTGHYGLNLLIKRLDNENWTTGTSHPYPQLKINYTYYFKCRGIS